MPEPVRSSASFNERRDRAGVAMLYCLLCFVVGMAFVGPESRSLHPDADVSNLLSSP